ncbi:unnamed protein product [Ectocarpus sp. 8 AP-2014]
MHPADRGDYLHPTVPRLTRPNKMRPNKNQQINANRNNTDSLTAASSTLCCPSSSLTGKATRDSYIQPKGSHTFYHRLFAS